MSNANEGCLQRLVRMEIGLQLLKDSSEFLKRYQNRKAEALYGAIDEYLAGVVNRLQDFEAFTK